MSGPVLPKLLRLADPVHADDEPEVTGPARLDAGQSVLEHRRAAGRHLDLLRRSQEGVRRRLPAQAALLGDHPVHPHVEQTLPMPAESSTCWVFALEDTMAVDIPFSRTARM